MAGFTGYDQIINAMTVDLTGQKLIFSKISATAGVANVPMDMWKATGMPAAGAYGAVGKANGRVTTSATAGALPYTNPAGGTTAHLLAMEATGITASATGTFILCDFIADVLFDYSETTGAVTGVNATSRLPATGGGQIWMPVSTGLSAVANTWTLGYTNSAGTSSRVTPTITGVASRPADKSITTSLWAPLQAGDSGVRSIDTITHVSGAGTGQFAAKIVRPIASLPVGTIGLVTARDFVVELPNMERIYDNSCLGLIWVPTGAQTPTFFGEVRIASG